MLETNVRNRVVKRQLEKLNRIHCGRWNKEEIQSQHEKLDVL